MTSATLESPSAFSSPSELTPQIEMQQLGISTEFELDRFHLVQKAVGSDIALREIERNVEAYEREFLKDEPVSLPHEYFHVRNGLFSEPIDHDLFDIKGQIDGRERDGRTLQGFKRFEESLVHASQDDQVVVWYSPAGKAGNEEPFDNIYFDSGRLYLGFRQGNAKSMHIDIKVNEEKFPVLDFLDKLNYFSNEEVRPPNQTFEEATFHYLDNPLKTAMTTQEMVDFMQGWAQQNQENGQKEVYVSQRDSQTTKPHTLSDIMDVVQQMIVQYHSGEIEASYNPGRQKDTAQFVQSDIRKLYLQRILPYVEANGGTFTLYGCSTTSTVSTKDFFKSASPGSVFSSYSTVDRLSTSRIPLNIPGLEKSWSFTEKGECQECHRPHTEVGLLGPCKVCKTCEKKYDDIAEILSTVLGEGSVS